MNERPVMLITGASSGIGATTARLAVENGYRVALAARRRDPLEELATELGGPQTALALSSPTCSDPRSSPAPPSPPWRTRGATSS